ncbi:riboflavin synthase subunit alpha [Desulfuromonas versatilis]|uniref:Riboflavin synthase n=1 Tax=Desulfuromonas versatilis TaxID=2802975 RepID=A0ABN6DXL6_9BACT|nr:riboflavin synthase [Desulfuromonas versatilis]BCR04765.1 riboflavin synthase subunit alpha [Desulfuromonas versatilis]
MFTGLIEDLGSIREMQRGADSVRLKVATRLPMEEIRMGESIAVNGICLTVVAFGGGTFSADVSPETLSRSNLGRISPGSRVNLERALRLSDRLGGHLVSGHIDAVAEIAERYQEGNAVRFRFAVPGEISRYVVEKGSIAVDGISLTVNSVTAESFTVAVIPHSLAMTTLQERVVGDLVNIETDLIGKYVERLLKGDSGGQERKPLNLEFLAKHGFL